MTLPTAMRSATNTRLLLLLVPVLLTSIPGYAQRTAENDSTLHAVQHLYESGSYLNAELEARRYLERRTLADTARIVAEQWIAFSLVAQGNTDAAADHFAIILALDSTYSLDPVLTSPKIRQAFDAAQHRVRDLETGERESLPAASDGSQLSPSFRLLLFPGWDQINQGRATKGYVLLGAGGLSLVSTLTFDILRRSARDEYLEAGTPQDAASLYTTYDRYSKAEYYSAAAFVVVYLYSAFDAFFDLPPRFQTSVTETPSGVRLNFSWTL